MGQDPSTGGQGSGDADSRRTHRIALIGAIAACISAAAVFLPLVYRVLDRDSTHADRIASCLQTHGMEDSFEIEKEEYDSEHQRDTGEISRTVFSECRWPPKETQQADGYSRIEVLTQVGPAVGEITFANVTDRIDATCEIVEVVYQMATMGDYSELPPVQFPRGIVAYALDGEVEEFIEPWPGSAETYPQPHEIISLHNGKRLLNTARCTDSVGTVAVTAEPNPHL